MVDWASCYLSSPGREATAAQRCSQKNPPRTCQVGPGTRQVHLEDRGDRTTGTSRHRPHLCSRHRWSARALLCYALISGKNLHEAIREFHARHSHSARLFEGVPFRELLQRFIDVCHALHYAHSRNIIHRDLKPANIMLGGHGETLVIDWGLAEAEYLAIGPAPSQGPNRLAPPCLLFNSVVISIFRWKVHLRAPRRLRAPRAVGWPHSTTVPGQ